MSASVFGPMSSPIQPDGIELMSTTLGEIERRGEEKRRGEEIRRGEEREDMMREGERREGDAR